MNEIVVFDDFAERSCQFFRTEYTVNNGYGCAHPDQQETELVAVGDPGRQCLIREGKCYSFSCPLGAALSPSSEPEDAVLMRQYGWDPDDFGDEVAFLLDPRGAQAAEGEGAS